MAYVAIIENMNAEEREDFDATLLNPGRANRRSQGTDGLIAAMQLGRRG